MKKLLAPLAVLLACIAVAATVYAPASTSDADYEAHITALEDRTSELTEENGVLARHLLAVDNDVEFLLRQYHCMRTGMSATIYKDGPNSKAYLAPTRSAKHKRFWVVMMTPGCMPKKPTLHQLSWKW